MALARTFTERIATALLSLVASGMALGGVAMAGLGATLRQTGFAMEGMPVITGGLMAVGAVLALSGGMSMIWTYAAGYSGARLSVAGGTRVIMLLLFATALPVAVATQLGALAEYWQDVARLAAEYEVWESANGPSALVFAPVMGVLLVPGVQAIAAIVMALSCALAVVLVLARSGAAHRLLTIGALLAAGLTIASWVGVAVTERLAPGVETLVRTTAAPGAQEQDRALALLHGIAPWSPRVPGRSRGRWSQWPCWRQARALSHGLPSARTGSPQTLLHYTVSTRPRERRRCSKPPTGCTGPRRRSGGSSTTGPRERPPQPTSPAAHVANAGRRSDRGTW